MKDRILERFLRYVRVDTGSDSRSESTPSTARQLLFLEVLAEELREIGLEDVRLESGHYLTATVPASEGCEGLPVIGFISHVDTSPDAPSAGISPLVHVNYNGEAIVLPHGSAITMEEYPELSNFIGHTLITSSGDTLLGADDKAGVTSIVTAAEELINNSKQPHGKIRIAFTCDEEVGRGADNFDVIGFGAEYAYTMDSGGIGLLEWENFNAAGATVTITGRNIHPGYAKGKMVNALEVAHRFHGQLPSDARPELTEGREGFYHLNSMSGNVSHAELHYIIREFDDTRFAQMQRQMLDIADTLNQELTTTGKVEVVITEQYRNMRSVIEPRMEIVERVRTAITNLGIPLIEHPIRGGTDGARLSFMGLPCPNIFTGGMNFHSKHEYCTLQGIELATQVIISLATK